MYDLVDTRTRILVGLRWLSGGIGGWETYAVNGGINTHEFIFA